MHFLLIVTYNPNLQEFISRVNILKDHGVNVIIIDNNSSISFEISHVTLIHLYENIGIAAAQNIGIRKALAFGASSITFLDQDTSIDIESIEILHSEVHSGSSVIAVPLCRSRNSGVFYDIVWWDFQSNILRRNPTVDSSGFRWTNIAISSGLTVNCNIFDEDSYMDEGLFIDYVDTEWCLRMFHRGYIIRVITKINLLHEIGDHTIDFKFFKLPIHSPSRRYYRVRNSLILMRYPHIPLLFSIRNFIIISIQQVLIILFYRKNIFSYTKYYFSAVVDSLRIKL